MIVTISVFPFLDYTQDVSYLLIRRNTLIVLYVPDILLSTLNTVFSVIFTTAL